MHFEDGIQIRGLFADQGPLTERLETLHRHILESIPAITRISCAIYEPGDDELHTFINSTREGTPITRYRYKLSDSTSLKEILATGRPRVIPSIQQAVSPGTTHSDWLLEQGYKSSFTVPIYNDENYLGLIFFDASVENGFTPRVQRDLLVFCNLINMAITTELTAVKNILASAQMARDFANLRDFETGAHLERMSRYALVIAREIAPKFGLSDENIEHIGIFAPLHDIGKIGIPDRILLKPGKLDPEERQIMNTHVQLGTEIIEKIIGDFRMHHLSDSRIMLNIVGGHHEFMDGSGYPRGLRGDEVPVEARIITVADIFDALTSRRPYKKEWPVSEAIAELKRMVSNGKLDNDCVEALLANISELDDIIARYPDEE